MKQINFKNYPLTLSLIISNVVIFFLPLFWGINVFSMNNETLFDLGAMFGESLILEHEVWRLLSSMFLHANFEHLFMNMATLLFIGIYLEQIFSRFIYLSIYFTAGIISGLIPIYFQDFGTVSLGASGAIFGIAGIKIGFTLMHYKKLKKEFVDYIKGYTIFLVINLFMGITMPNVGFSAHLVGLVVGILGGMALHKKIYYYLFLLFLFLLSYYFYAYFLPSLYVSSVNVFF